MEEENVLDRWQVYITEGKTTTIFFSDINFDLAWSKFEEACAAQDLPVPNRPDMPKRVVSNTNEKEVKIENLTKE